MGIFSRFEDKMEDTVEGAASRMSKAPISPVQIAKRAERQMRRETMVGAGKEYAPTLYTVLVNPEDDARLFGYYPTLAGETETYLKAKATEQGLAMDGNPLVRFIVDEGLRHGKFDIIAEVVAAPIIKELRAEEMHHYGLALQAQKQPARATRTPRSSRAERTPSASYAPHAAGAVRSGFNNSASYDDYNDKAYDDYATEGAYDDYDDYNNYNGYGTYDDYDSADDMFTDAPDKAYDSTYDTNHATPQQPMRPSPTVAYAGRARNSSGMPDYRQVNAHLIACKGRRTYDLAGSVVTLGRESKNDIPVKDASASRYHAELKMTPQGTWVITDLNSTNGTLVNGTKMATQALYPGDIITIGKTDFEFTTAS